jgi:predicted O-methyltransferase YrrM
MAKAQPDKDYKIVSLELVDTIADTARDNLKRAGFTEPQVEVITGDALTSLKAMKPEVPFDLVTNSAFVCHVLD